MEKGVVELCEAFLLASRSNPRMQLRLAGWGTLEAKLRAKYGGNSRIDFLGAIDGPEKEEALANSTAVIIPSLWEEVFGVVTVEAFAFGKPVIASRVGGLPELVRTGETGWLVEAGNIPALAEQLLFVANIDPLAIKKINQICKEYSHEFAVERILKDYLDIYNQLLQ
jgi:glycosyltransferase involved in cell wall biosynthesis